MNHVVAMQLRSDAFEFLPGAATHKLRPRSRREGEGNQVDDYAGHGDEKGGGDGQTDGGVEKSAAVAAPPSRRVGRLWANMARFILGGPQDDANASE